MHRATSFIRSFSWLFGVVLMALTANANPISATGAAAIVSGDLESARAQALEQALRAAVRFAMKGLGAEQEGVDPRLDQAVYAQPSGFVARVTPKSESTEGNILTVAATVEVDQAALTAIVGPRRAAEGAKARPGKVLILCTERIGPSHVVAWSDFVWSHGSKTTVLKIEDSPGTVDAVIAEGFTNAGFDPVDPAVLKGKIAAPSSVTVVDLGNQTATSYAKASDADYVVLVKASAKAVAPQALVAGQMVSGQAILTAKLLRASDGKLMGVATTHGAQVHIEPDTACVGALEQAAREAVTTLVSKF
jgi:Flagellar assembly protein T, N-terminal domain